MTLSRSWEVMPRHLIFSGAPDRVDPIVAGDMVTGGVEGSPDLTFTVA